MLVGGAGVGRSPRGTAGCWAQHPGHPGSHRSRVRRPGRARPVRRGPAIGDRPRLAADAPIRDPRWAGRAAAVPGPRMRRPGTIGRASTRVDHRAGADAASGLGGGVAEAEGQQRSGTRGRGRARPARSRQEHPDEQTDDHDTTRRVRIAARRRPAPAGHHLVEPDHPVLAVLALTLGWLTIRRAAPPRRLIRAARAGRAVLRTARVRRRARARPMRLKRVGLQPGGRCPGPRWARAPSVATAAARCRLGVSG
jgi:hypothetical protein